MATYIAIQGDKPIPVGASEDLIKVMTGAEEWANYSHKTVAVLKIEGPFVDLHQYVFPK